MHVQKAYDNVSHSAIIGKSTADTCGGVDKEGEMTVHGSLQILVVLGEAHNG